MSCAQGTSSQTIVHFSSVMVRRIHSGFTPRSKTALLPEIRLPNQCIVAPVW